MTCIRLIAILLALGASSLASAAAKCPDTPKDKWMPIHDLQKKIVNEYGFAIKQFKVDGNCYEIYGWGLAADGKKWQKIEVYFNPANGDIVKKEIED